MKLLSIETATTACSVALIENGVVLDHAHDIVGRGHAERLLPMIAALRDGGRADAIHVDVGPGSFTGIRVGIAAARALGFAWSAPVIGFASLALIAAIDGLQRDTCIVIEGGHGEVFLARYEAGANDVAPTSLPFETAVAVVSTARIVGNAAARLVAARGWGEAVSVDPDARAAVLLVGHMTLPPVPLYGRQADAVPMAIQP